MCIIYMHSIDNCIPLLAIENLIKKSVAKSTPNNPLKEQQFLLASKMAVSYLLLLYFLFCFKKLKMTPKLFVFCVLNLKILCKDKNL